MNDRFRRTYATLLACKPCFTRAVFSASSPCPAPRVDHVGKEAAGAPPTFSAVPGTNRVSVEHLQPRGSYGIFTTSVGGTTSVNRVRGVAPAGGAKDVVIKEGGRSRGVANVSMVTRHGTEVSREADGVAEVDSATGSTGRREATSAGNSARNATSHCAGAANCLDVTYENTREEDGKHANEVWETGRGSAHQQATSVAFYARSRRPRRRFEGRRLDFQQEPSQTSKVPDRSRSKGGYSLQVACRLDTVTSSTRARFQSVA